MNKNNNLGDWITTKEASTLLNLGKDRIRKLCRSERITCQKHGREWLVYKPSVIAYGQSERKPGPKPPAYNPPPAKKPLHVREGEVTEKKQFEVTLHLSQRHLDYLVETYGSVPDGVRQLVEADMGN
jgi:excisionase family DNA binding protein